MSRGDTKWCGASSVCLGTWVQTLCDGRGGSEPLDPRRFLEAVSQTGIKAGKHAEMALYVGQRVANNSRSPHSRINVVCPSSFGVRVDCDGVQREREVCGQGVHLQDSIAARKGQGRGA